MTDILAAEAAEIAELEKQVTLTPEPKTDTPPEDLDQELPDDPQPEPEAEAQAKLNPGQIVRKRDFLEQKERREAAEKRVQELEARYAEHFSRAEQRLADLAKQFAPAQPQAPAEPQIKVPDRDVDPIGYFEAQLALRDQKLAEVEKWRHSQSQASEDDIKRQKIGAEVSRLESEFAKVTPDYPQAQEFLQKRWADEARVLGVPEHQAIRFYAEQVVRAAAAQNKNPGEVAYEFAKARGYQKGNGNGAVTQPKTGPDLETIQRGMASAKSVSTAPGRAAPGMPTIDALLKMDDDEFASKFASRDSKEWDKTMRKLMGAA